ncbi:MAG: hypothetical protein ACUVR8_12685 [Acidobacteriota bacterium]
MRRSALITFPVMASVFLGGGIIGFGLTVVLTAERSLARLFGLCALPLAFIAGAHLWLSYALLRGLAHLLRRGALPRFAQSDVIPPGSEAFVFTSIATSTILGVIVALSPSRLGFLPTLAVFIVLGVGYGIICHLLGRNGFLPVCDIESGQP